MKIDSTTNQVSLNTMFHWYEEDFLGRHPHADAGADQQALLDFIYRYADDENRAALLELRSKPNVKFYEYNWALNGPGSRVEHRPRPGKEPKNEVRRGRGQWSAPRPAEALR